MVAPRQKTDSSADQRANIVLAALDLADQRPWVHVRMADIAAQADMPLADLLERFECKDDVLAGIARYFDKMALADFGARDDDASDKDALFDILMCRFEAINTRRAAVLSIMDEVLAEPKMLLVSLPHVGRSMAWMLEGAGIETSGWRGAVRVAGLMGVHVYAARAWMRDESPDLAQTMAALDRALSHTEGLASRLGG